MYKHRGFTLIELMITIAIVGIVVAIAIPSFKDMIVKRKIRGASEMIYSQLVFAKGQAIKQSVDISLSFTADADGADGAWAFGVTDKANCDLTIDDDCTITYPGGGGVEVYQFSGSDFSDVTLTNNFTNNNGGFDSVRGLALDDGATMAAVSRALTLTTADPAYELRVVLSKMGNVSMCSPSTNHVSGYTTCP